MTSLKANSFLMLGASGASLLLAAVLLGTGQLHFRAFFLGGRRTFLLPLAEAQEKITANVKPGSP